MNNSQGIIVPIRVEAITIGIKDSHQDDHFLPAFADFQNLSDFKAYMSDNVMRKPFKGKPLEQGIHLHWNLPNSLRHGHVDENSNLNMQAVPDRWLITRVITLKSTGKPDSISTKCWVVESNYISNDIANSPTNIPVSPDGDPPYFQFLGKVYNYQDWVTKQNKPENYKSKIDATGYGLPDFASCYANCQNVFGFLDNTLNNDKDYDPSNSVISYTVIGWYSNKDNDPVSENKLDGTKNDFGWLFGQPKGVVPEYSVFQGTVYDLEYNPMATYFPSYKDAIAPEITIGNTPMEAFSAYAATKLKGKIQNAEQLLNAFQLGVLQELDVPGGLAMFKEAEYNKSFSPHDAGLIWDIKPAKSSKTDSEPLPKIKSVALKELPETIGDDLNKLNVAQTKHNEYNQQLISLKKQIFADWCKYTEMEYVDPPQPDNFNAASDMLNSEKNTTLNNLNNQISAINSTISNLQTKIKAELPADLELVPVAAPRYYSPNDPIIFLTGDGITNSPPDNSKTINCRLTDQITSNLEFANGLVEGSGAYSLDQSNIPGAFDSTSLDNIQFDTVDALYKETVFDNPVLGNYITNLLKNLGGNDNPAVLGFDKVTSLLNQWQSEFLDNKPITVKISSNGIAPQSNIGFRKWAIPWNPIGLSWFVNYAPVQAINEGNDNYSTSFINDNFAEGDDYNYAIKKPSFSKELQFYEGGILLSPDASINLQSQIKKYLQYFDDPELEKVLGDLSAYPTLAQSLGGFNEAFMMLHQIMQLPVSDPNTTDQGRYVFTQEIAGIVEKNNHMSALSQNQYNPFRAGKVKLMQIILFDEFGRFKSIDLNRLVVTENIPVDPMDPLSIFPPLRLCQPSRLDFRWLAADDNNVEMNSHPVNNPICGWAVPNHLDSSLMFYDSSGKAIGSVYPSFENNNAIWQNAPGHGKFNDGIDTAFEGQNPVLANFAKSVFQYGTSYLKNLISTFDESHAFIMPGNHQDNDSIPVLIGRPLAIVQSKLDIGLLGYPNPDQSIMALHSDKDKTNPYERTLHNFINVDIYVGLGGMAKLDDGLIGYFFQKEKNEKWITDYSTLYAAAADGSDPHIKKTGLTDIALQLNPESNPVMLTMLVDPRCSIHAYTGILPIKKINIPTEIYSNALNNLSFTFLTAPILQNNEDIKLPVPPETNGKWSWQEVENKDWNSAAIGKINTDANMQSASKINEGWLKLEFTKPKKQVTMLNNNFKNPPNSNICGSIVNQSGLSEVLINKPNTLYLNLKNNSGENFNMDNSGPKTPSLTIDFSKAGNNVKIDIDKVKGNGLEAKSFENNQLELVVNTPHWWFANNLWQIDLGEVLIPDGNKSGFGIISISFDNFKEIPDSTIAAHIILTTSAYLNKNLPGILAHFREHNTVYVGKDNDNTLKLRIIPEGEQQIGVKEESAIYLNLLPGHSGHFENMTDLASAQAIVPDLGDNDFWKVEKTDGLDHPILKISPKATNMPKLGSTENKFIDLKLSNIKSTQKPGGANMHVHFSNFEDSPETCSNLNVSLAQSSVVINSFTSDQTTLSNINQPTAIHLSWDVSNATTVMLSGIGVVDSVVKMKEIFIEETTNFVLTAFDSAFNQICSQTCTVTVTPSLSSRLVPKGTIMIWSGKQEDIPPNWTLCDKSEPWIPDLRDKFIMGAGGSEQPLASGNADTHTHQVTLSNSYSTTAGEGSHSHNMPSNWYARNLSCGVHTGIDTRNDFGATIDGGAHQHSVQVSFNNVGSGNNQGDIRPSWFALCYIIKVSD